HSCKSKHMLVVSRKLSGLSDLLFNRRSREQEQLEWKHKYTRLEPGKVSPRLPVPKHIIKPPYVDAKSMPEVANEIQLHDAEGIACMRASGQLAARVLDYAGTLVKPGVTTDEIDRAVHEMIIDARAYPSPLGYVGFPKNNSFAGKPDFCLEQRENISHIMPGGVGIIGPDYWEKAKSCTEKYPLPWDGPFLENKGFSAMGKIEAQAGTIPLPGKPDFWSGAAGKHIRTLCPEEVAIRGPDYWEKAKSCTEKPLRGWTHFWKTKDLSCNGKNRSRRQGIHYRCFTKEKEFLSMSNTLHISSESEELSRSTPVLKKSGQVRRKRIIQTKIDKAMAKKDEKESTTELCITSKFVATEDTDLGSKPLAELIDRSKQKRLHSCMQQKLHSCAQIKSSGIIRVEVFPSTVQLPEFVMQVQIHIQMQMQMQIHMQIQIQIS
ncbi:hypothetical protein KI387_024563, partial [Taxus chinensis]